MIQIDMKRPEHCVDCPFSLENCCLVLGKYISLKQWAKGGTQEWCPLKEQEAVEPIPYHRSDGTIFRYECRKCRTKIFKNDLFCRHCGQAVKWE